MKRLLGWVSLFGVASLVVAACGGDDSMFGGTGDGGGGGGGDDGSFGDDGGGSFGEGGGINTDSGLNGCATTSEQAQQLPLDLVIVQDTSGSMWERTASDQTKWDAVKAALTGFFNDPQSAGIGVGIQFFPLFSNAPQACNAAGQCGAAGPCLLKVCSRLQNGATPCETDAECTGGGNTCSIVLNGQCHGDGEVKCRIGQNDCAVTPLGNLGTCDPIVSSVCVGETVDCNVPSYTTLAAPIAPLPTAAGALNGALAARWPNGTTPTRPALEGGIAAAKAYAASNPGHTVVVVLATDGLPSDGSNGTAACAPNTIGDSATAASTGVTQGVKTFVIGVFSQQEQQTATSNLNQIAAAGGTGQAFIVNTSSNVNQQFEQALNTIRGAALPCQYKLPVPDGGQTPDYTKVNVQYTAGNGNVSVIGYATNAQGCDPTKGGWYYDQDPATGKVPTTVLLCPATCNVVKNDPKGKIDVVQGCKTVVVVK